MNLSTKKRVFRSEIAIISTMAMKLLSRAQCTKDVMDAARTTREACIQIGISEMDSLRWSNAVFHLARKFRTDIYKQFKLYDELDAALFRLFGREASDCALSEQEAALWMREFGCNAKLAAMAIGKKRNYPMQAA